MSLHCVDELYSVAYVSPETRAGTGILWESPIPLSIKALLACLFDIEWIFPGGSNGSKADNDINAPWKTSIPQEERLEWYIASMEVLSDSRKVIVTCLRPPNAYYCGDLNIIRRECTERMGSVKRSCGSRLVETKRGQWMVTKGGRDNRSDPSRLIYNYYVIVLLKSLSPLNHRCLYGVREGFLLCFLAMYLLQIL